MDRDHKYV